MTVYDKVLLNGKQLVKGATGLLFLESQALMSSVGKRSAAYLITLLCMQAAFACGILSLSLWLANFWNWQVVSLGMTGTILLAALIAFQFTKAKITVSPETSLVPVEEPMEKEDFLRLLDTAKDNFVEITQQVEQVAKTAINPVRTVENVIRTNPLPIILGTVALGMIWGARARHSMILKEKLYEQPKPQRLRKQYQKPSRQNWEQL